MSMKMYFHTKEGKMKDKNVILITLDTLRVDHLSCYGYKRNTSPNIDLLARNGILFEQAIANGPYTMASFPAILTSTYPFSLGGYDNIRKRVSIAEIFKEYGYFTFAIPNNPLLFSNHGYDKGFTIFEEELKRDINVKIDKNKLMKIAISNKIIYNLSKKIYHIVPFSLQSAPYLKAEKVNEQIISVLQNNTPNRFFAWIHYMDIHHPYGPPKKFLKEVYSKKISDHEVKKLNRKRSENVFDNSVEIKKDELEKMIALYDGEIRYTDHYIGELVKKLGEMGYSNTLFIITADHGEEFMQHGAIGHAGENWFTHMYDELLHVPLIFSGADHSRKRISDQVCHLDILPTIVELLGLGKSEGFQGESILPLIKGAKGKSDYVISEASLFNKYKGAEKIPENEKKIISCRTKDWKYIYRDDFPSELYNLRRDPRETNNLVDEERKRAEEFKEVLFKHLEKQKAFDEKRKVDRRLKKLRSSGRI